MIKAIIFDMDGVLVDACDWHREAFNEALKHFYNYEISLEDHYKNFNGLPTKVKLEILEGRGIASREHFEAIENIKQEKTLEIIEKKAKYRQEKVELINFLKSKNIKVACYTNSIRKTASLMLDKTGVLSLLDLLITNQDVKKSKPSPDGYLLCLDKLNVTNKDVIIIEDSDKGIQAAKESGCFYVRVKNQEDVNIDLLKDYVL
jgi:HAD superfamily hydrolase (TIGR01509 family)